ncbi:hypothetical protein SAMN02745194_01147 [Roseomonas rosea]|uniref:CD-NTase-associated protein 12/Pycsar effector protein TIR domain-containing protein n=1 Tax=Muricoccus roseus TaxID=198092 RepID=A0A1M6E7Y0_9PROT|nr:hypothetical protein [Roseomonas rosea]SHI81597.1 hypothetical protein SAMN02745194_01147 [Roseomonas rosea]
MSTTRRSTRVFFSWQSDLPQGPTTLAVRAALRSAASQIEADHPVDIVIEEATSNSAGSPYIPFELADKIRRADIFVGDITTVARISEDGKSLPNPNVTFELGVASAHLGWQRIIMLFNEELATLDKLPFDFDRHRISKFRIKEGTAAQKAGAAKLSELMKAAVERILLDNPKRPRELEGIPPEQRKHARDVEMIHWFMRQLHTGLLDQHIMDMPNFLNWHATQMFEGIDSVVRSSDFKLYNTDFYNAAIGLRGSLAASLRYMEHYDETSNPMRQIYRRRGHDYKSIAKEKKVTREINESISELRKHLGNIISIIRSDYLEVDTNETNGQYIKNHTDLQKSFEPD